MKPGYLYVLVHPSDPDLYKIGVTTLQPKERLAQHNRHHEEYAGKIVKETGQEWELKTYIAVPDPYWAEAVFWGATDLANIPDRGGIEVERMSWKSVQVGLDAAKEARVRPPKPVPDWVHAYGAWMNKRLEGRGITLIGRVRSKFGKSNFQCKEESEDVSQRVRPAILCLLVHPDRPGLIKIGLTYRKVEHCHEENDWAGWELHRYRRVEEPVLAEALIWELLGCPLPNGREPISIDLHRAEQAFRELVPRMQQEFALLEKAQNELPPT